MILDAPAYRAAELRARSMLPNWRALQAHHLGPFERVGFPTRVESLTELGMLLDSMQDGRGEGYRREIEDLGGDAALFTEAAGDQIDMMAAFFPDRERPPAHDTMTAMFALYLKLRAAAPGFESALEFGPGCGYLSFFLARHKGLECYGQVEACESYFLLQNIVNIQAFGRNVGLLTEHCPWWDLDPVRRRFDVVTANACLLEMTPEARAQYLDLAAAVLKPGSPFVAQDLGSNHTAASYDEAVRGLFAEFDARGFKVRSIEEASERRPVPNVVWERV